MTTGDCGGPGPSSDPNFGGIEPMEPIAPTPFPTAALLVLQDQADQVTQSQWLDPRSSHPRCQNPLISEL